MPAAGPGAPAGAARPAAQVGEAPGAAASRGPLAGRVADRPGLPVRPRAAGALEGSGLLVAGAGRGGAGQGGGSGGGGVPQALRPGQQRHRVDGVAGRGAVLCAVPAGRRLPRAETTAGVGGMPRLDQEAGAADVVGSDGDAELAAAVAVALR